MCLNRCLNVSECVKNMLVSWGLLGCLETNRLFVSVELCPLCREPYSGWLGGTVYWGGCGMPNSGCNPSCYGRFVTLLVSGRVQVMRGTGAGGEHLPLVRLPIFSFIYSALFECAAITPSVTA